MGHRPRGRGRKPMHIHDLAAPEDEFPDGHAMALRLGHRTIWLPRSCARMWRSARSPSAGPRCGRSPKNRSRSLQTFADQAVIAIENVRLFEEVQARTREISAGPRAPDRDSEVLQVISRVAVRSPAGPRGMVGTAARSARLKCVRIWLRQDGDLPPRGAQRCPRRVSVKYASEAPDSRRAAARLVARTALEGARRSISGRAGSIPSTPGLEGQRLAGLQRERSASRCYGRGAASASSRCREGPEPFSDKQIELVDDLRRPGGDRDRECRLFEEVQARTQELSEALEQQTATAEVLKVISRSAFDLQTVLDTLVESAVAALRAPTCGDFRPLTETTYRFAGPTRLFA